MQENGSPILVKNTAGTLTFRNQADDASLNITATPASHGNEAHSSAFITSDNTGYFRQFYQKQGTVVQGAWSWSADASQTDYASVTGEGAGLWGNTSNAQNDEYKWSSVFLPAGTYKLTIVAAKTALSGIAEFLLGATSLGTIDLYNAIVTYNNVLTLTFTLAASTTGDFRLLMSTKNGASGGYAARISRVQLEKTG